MKPRQKPLIYIGLAMVAVVAVALSWWLGYRYAASHHDTVTITPTQAAKAMREDHFYKDYGNKTLIISGKVTDITGGPLAVLVFKTNDPYKLRCETIYQSGTFDFFADKARVTTTGGSAVRQPDGVLLKHCELI